MKPTTKVSIGGYAFNLEEDAYNEMSHYISSLNLHFKDKEEGKEIVSDLEIRIAELLQLRMNDVNSVISQDDVKAIIQIMGLPDDIDEEEQKAGESQTKEDSSIKRKLFRDGDNKILGGVCSGFARFFNIDPILIRISYVLIFIFSGIIFSGQTRAFLVLLYAILWFVMPKAKTFTQKLSMMGTPPPVNTIETRDELYVNKAKGSGLLNFIKIFFGIVLGIISLSVIIAIVAGVAAYWGFYGEQDFPGINIFADILGINSFDFNISAILLFVLPLLAILYLCIKLLLRSQFKVRDAVIFILGLVLWIGSGFYLAGITMKVVTMHEVAKDATEYIPVSTQSDTLYVKLSDNFSDAKYLNHASPSMMYYKGKGKNYWVSVLPKVLIKYDSTASNFNIEIKKKAFDTDAKLALNKAQNAILDYSLVDSTLTINPHIYNKKNQWDRELFEIIITQPAGKTVICKDGL